MWACENGHFEIVKLLLKHKADINWRADVMLVNYNVVFTRKLLIFRITGMPCMLLVPRIV